MKTIFCLVCFLLLAQSALALDFQGKGYDGSPCSVSYEVSKDGKQISNLKFDGAEDGPALGAIRSSEKPYTNEALDISYGLFGNDAPNAVYKVKFPPISGITYTEKFTVTFLDSIERPSKITIDGILKAGILVGMVTLQTGSFSCSINP